MNKELAGIAAGDTIFVREVGKKFPVVEVITNPTPATWITSLREVYEKLSPEWQTFFASLKLDPGIIIDTPRCLVWLRGDGACWRRDDDGMVISLHADAFGSNFAKIANETDAAVLQEYLVLPFPKDGKLLQDPTEHRVVTLPTSSDFNALGAKIISLIGPSIACAYDYIHNTSGPRDIHCCVWNTAFNDLRIKIRIPYSAVIEAAITQLKEDYDQLRDDVEGMIADGFIISDPDEDSESAQESIEFEIDLDEVDKEVAGTLIDTWLDSHSIEDLASACFGARFEAGTPRIGEQIEFFKNLTAAAQHYSFLDPKQVPALLNA